MEKLKKIWQAIWTFLNSRLFVVIIVVLLIMIGAGQCKRILDLNRKVDKHEQNISALTDSLKFERTKNGELLVSIDGYIATEKELKTINKSLWEQVQGQKGKVLALTNTIITLRQDSANLSKTVDKQNVIIAELKQVSKDKYLAEWTLPHKYDSSNFFIVKGKTFVQVLSNDPFKMRHDTTYLVDFQNSINVTYGEKIEKGKLRIFIESAYPGFSVKSMEGVLIDPKDWPSIFKPTKRHWFTGFGVGPSINAGWNVLEAKPAINLGISIHYNIYEW